MSRVTFHEDVLETSSSFSPTSKQQLELPMKSSLRSPVPSSRRCICGKILPSFLNATSGSWCDTNATPGLRNAISQETNRLFSSPPLPKAMSALDELYQKSFEKDKMKRLATFDLIQSLQDDCTFRPHHSVKQGALYANRRSIQCSETESSLSDVIRPSRSGMRGGLARERLLRGDWCFDCARKHASGSGRRQIKAPQETGCVNHAVGKVIKASAATTPSNARQISDGALVLLSTSEDNLTNQIDLQTGLFNSFAEQECESDNSLRFTSGSSSSSFSFNFLQQVEKEDMWLSSESESSKETSQRYEGSKHSAFSALPLVSEETGPNLSTLESPSCTSFGQPSPLPREALRMESVFSILSLDDDEDSFCAGSELPCEKVERDASSVSLIPSAFEGLDSPNSFRVVIAPQSREETKSDEIAVTGTKSDLEETFSQSPPLYASSDEYPPRDVDQLASQELNETKEEVTVVNSSVQFDASDSHCKINEVKVDLTAKVSLSSLSNDADFFLPIKEEKCKHLGPPAFGTPQKSAALSPLKLPLCSNNEFLSSRQKTVTPLSASLIRKDSLESRMHSKETPSSPNDVRASIAFDGNFFKHPKSISMEAEANHENSLSALVVDETFETILVENRGLIHGHGRVVIVPRFSADPKATAKIYSSSSSSDDGSEGCSSQQGPGLQERTCVSPVAPCTGIRPFICDAQEAARNLIT